MKLRCGLHTVGRTVHALVGTARRVIIILSLYQPKPFHFFAIAIKVNHLINVVHAMVIIPSAGLKRRQCDVDILFGVHKTAIFNGECYV